MISSNSLVITDFLSVVGRWSNSRAIFQGIRASYVPRTPAQSDAQVLVHNPVRQLIDGAAGHAATLFENAELGSAAPLQPRTRLRERQAREPRMQRAWIT